MRTRNAPFAEALKGERSTYKNRMCLRHKQKTSIGPKKKGKKKHAHILGATYSQIRKQNRRGSKACTMIITDDNEANKKKRQSSIKDMDPSPCHR
jgi:hypothetical protein